jgi:hypothetical protein
MYHIRDTLQDRKQAAGKGRKGGEWRSVSRSSLHLGSASIAIAAPPQKRRDPAIHRRK